MRLLIARDYLRNFQSKFHYYFAQKASLSKQNMSTISGFRTIVAFIIIEKYNLIIIVNVQLSVYLQTFEYVLEISFYKQRFCCNWKVLQQFFQSDW